MKQIFSITRSLKPLIMVVITITLLFSCNLDRQEDLEDIRNNKKKSEISELTNSDEFHNLYKEISQFGKVIRINYRKLSRTNKELFRNQLTAISTFDCKVTADSILNVVSSIIKVDFKPYLVNINNYAYLLRVQLEEKGISIEEFQNEASKYLLSSAKPSNLKNANIEYDPNCLENCILLLSFGSLTCATIGLPYIPACLALLSYMYANCVIGCEI